MDIIPEKTGDDYDFILYRAEGDDLCEAIFQKKIKIY